MIPLALLLAIVLPLQTAATDPLLTSPLFGYPKGGDPFDDGATAIIPQVVRVHTLRICYGDFIDGIQLLYLLQDNSTFIGLPHGKLGEECNKLKDSKMTNIVFKEDEVLMHIEGKIHRSWEYISQLLLFTSISGGSPTLRGGPFGHGDYQDKPFSLTGNIMGIFGRRGTVLDAIGFYIDTPSLTLTSYQKTVIIGGGGGNDFDDLETLISNNEKPLKITNIIINYSWFINGIQVTYMVSNGHTTSIAHGSLAEQDANRQHHRFGILNFDADEWITKVDISLNEGSTTQVINYLEIETTNSQGSVRSYGPFGNVHPDNNITSIEHVVHGFYGRSDDDHLNALGLYF